MEVDIDVGLLCTLGKNAIALYLALLRLADSKTGELRCRGEWLTVKRFDREAHMCKDVRIAAMRELVAAGLVTFTRPRVCEEIGGRMRSVVGPIHYVVHHS